MPTVVNCPTCKEKPSIGEQSPFRPFCSKRCQLIDLGEWSFENNRISTPISNANELSQDMIEDIEAMLAKNDDSFFKE